MTDARLRHSPSWMVMVLLAFLSPNASASDCNRNGIDDLRDIETGASRDCNANWIPDECDRLPINYGLEEVETILPQPTSYSAHVLLDLDGDADLDLAFSNLARNTVDLFENRGSLHFAPPTAFPGSVAVGQYPLELITGDLDGDAAPDLATVDQYDGVVTVLLNDRGGSFAAAASEVSWRPSSLGGADLDDDGDLDLVVVSDGDAILYEILWNQGNGTFSAAESHQIHPGVSIDPLPKLALGDLTVAGRPDLLVALGDGSMVIVQNPTTGTATMPTSLRGYAAALGDLDGDGLLDVATDSGIYLNAGAPGFTELVFSSPDLFREMRPFLADLDSNGSQDVIFGGFGPTAALNHGGGRFGAARFLPGGGPAVAGDLDGSGQVSVVTLRDVKVLTPRPRNNSRDCNANTIPDECDILSGRSSDCNGNGIPDECDLIGRVSEDCNQNGILDVCEKDCNHNGIHDDCDIANRTSRDNDHDGLPDECGAVFTYGFEAPAVLQGIPGETRTFDVYLTINSTNLFAPDGAQGWMVSMFSEGCQVEAIQIKGLLVNTIYDKDDDSDPGTPAIHHDPFLFDLGDSFIPLAHVATNYEDSSEKGAVSAVVMKSQEKMVLQPGLTQRIARLTVKATVPVGEACIPMTIYYEDGGWYTISSPYHNVVTYRGASVTPELTSTTILLCPARFRRGDANSDNLVDISDAIFTLRYLFQGGDPLSCKEAGNVNNDQFLDLSDPVYLLESLFLGGGLGRIAAPGAYQCGSGGEFRGLSCDSSPCSPGPPR